MRYLEVCLQLNMDHLHTVPMYCCYWQLRSAFHSKVLCSCSLLLEYFEIELTSTFHLCHCSLLESQQEQLHFSAQLQLQESGAAHLDTPLYKVLKYYILGFHLYTGTPDTDEKKHCLLLVQYLIRHSLLENENQLHLWICNQHECGRYPLNHHILHCLQSLHGCCKSVCRCFNRQ